MFGNHLPMGPTFMAMLWCFALAVYGRRVTPPMSQAARPQSNVLSGFARAASRTQGAYVGRVGPSTDVSQELLALQASPALGSGRADTSIITDQDGKVDDAEALRAVFSRSRPDAPFVTGRRHMPRHLFPDDARARGHSSRVPRAAVVAAAAPVARAASYSLPVSLLIVSGLVFTLMRRFRDVRPVKTFITSLTNITIVDTEISPRQYVVGEDGELTEERGSVRWHLKTDDVLRRALKDGALGFGESYMDGDWQTDDIELFCNELLKLEGLEGGLGWRAVPLLASLAWGAASSRLIPRNTLKSAPLNVAHHYNISNRLYERMLGPTMMYSSGYFCERGMDLDGAQRAKMRQLAEKLELQPGMRVLEIGFGWGSMAHFLAVEYGVSVTALSLSQEQLNFAQDRNGHPNVEYLLQDYRTFHSAPFDRILSVEMIEHVGRKHLPEFFQACDDLLVADGLLLIQSIGCSIWKVMVGKSFIEKYIFPGCEPPQQSDFANVASSWHLEDWQSFGRDYARTMRLWRKNIGNWEGLEEFDDRFRRMWEYYLLSCAASFDRRRTKVWQVLYSKVASKRPRNYRHARGSPLSDTANVMSRETATTKVETTHNE